MSKPRRAKGSTITETGPALLVLFILIFFPMLDLVQMGAAYAMSLSYHDYMIREIACRKPTDADRATAVTRVQSEFTSSNFFNYLKASLPGGASSVQATYLPDATNPTSVRVSTRVQVLPFIVIPFIPAVPGLSAPLEFNFSTERPQEEKGLD